MENAALDVSTLLEPISTALTGAITPAQIVGLIASVVGVGMAFVLTWFGVRKLISIFRKAVTKGKISA